MNFPRRLLCNLLFVFFAVTFVARAAEEAGQPPVGGAPAPTGVVPEAAVENGYLKLGFEHLASYTFNPPPFDPAAGFNVGNAMQRNKIIYALADAALVVNSDFNKGGTWTGAVEQLDKYHFCPIFVRTGDGTGKGNEALLRKGAQPWPEPEDITDLANALARAVAYIVPDQQQESLPLIVEETPPTFDRKNLR